jgi:potassium voltage-gated channel Eag-related subfamily H protein 8
LLLEILYKIWVSGTFPNTWKNALVIPIPQPGKDSTDPTNYRPISLTSCLCKTFEKMINNRLVWYLENNGIITNFQSGFRKQRSINDHLVRLETFIREAFVNKQHLISIYFDLVKAYDTTWKYGIQKDLKDAGLKGRLPLFISGFLNDRHFKVRLGLTFSEDHQQEQGVS